MAKDKLEKQRTVVEEIEQEKLYENAFEWRFEFPEVLNEEGEFIGFDVVIGNPPYIRQEEFSDFKPYLKSKFSTFMGTADLYVYFVEQAFSILKKRGNFIFIIPNKWMRAGYGKELRRFIKSQSILEIIDFGDLPVFEEAITYPSVIHLKKDESVEQFKTTIIETLLFESGLSNYVTNQKIEVLTSELSDEGWSLTNSQVQKLLAKLKAKGTPLGEYVNGKIFRGIVSGLNEAFVIDEETKERLISEDPRSLEIIKPLIVGKNIKRYCELSTNKYLLLIQRGVSINNYPAIFKHLAQFENQLKAKAGNTKWFELQASPSDSQKFEEIKIMYPDISKNMNFTIDEKGHYSLNTLYNIGSSSIGLLAYLNSKLFHFYFKSVSNSIRGGYLRFFTDYMEKCKIPENVEFLETLAKTILNKTDRVNISDLEAQIDKLVYQLYNLSEEEINIIENA